MMLQIRTSYFGNIRNVVNPVAICATLPKWYKGYHYPKLAPGYQLLSGYKNGHINDLEYTNTYNNDVLQKLNPQEVVNELSHFSGSEKIVTLLCYETSDKFCHRHLVANWLYTTIGSLVVFENR